MSVDQGTSGVASERELGNFLVYYILITFEEVSSVGTANI